MSKVELPNGKYLVITFEMDNILDSSPGMMILFILSMPSITKDEFATSIGPDIERYTLTIG